MELFFYNNSLIIFSISVLIVCILQIPENILAYEDNELNYDYDYDYYDDEIAQIYPNQEHRLCDSRHCENTCDIPDADTRPCPFKLCHEGYFCKAGYVREIETDRCIPKEDCFMKYVVPFRHQHLNTNNKISNL